MLVNADFLGHDAVGVLQLVAFSIGFARFSNLESPESWCSELFSGRGGVMEVRLSRDIVY